MQYVIMVILHKTDSSAFYVYAHEHTKIVHIEPLKCTCFTVLILNKLDSKAYIAVDLVIMTVSCGRGLLTFNTSVLFHGRERQRHTSKKCRRLDNQSHTHTHTDALSYSGNSSIDIQSLTNYKSDRNAGILSFNTFLISLKMHFTHIDDAHSYIHNTLGPSH